MSDGGDGNGSGDGAAGADGTGYGGGDSYGGGGDSQGGSTGASSGSGDAGAASGAGKGGNGVGGGTGTADGGGGTTGSAGSGGQAGSGAGDGSSIASVNLVDVVLGDGGKHGIIGLPLGGDGLASIHVGDDGSTGNNGGDADLTIGVLAHADGNATGGDGHGLVAALGAALDGEGLASVSVDGGEGAGTNDSHGGLGIDVLRGGDGNGAHGDGDALVDVDANSGSLLGLEQGKGVLSAVLGDADHGAPLDGHGLASVDVTGGGSAIGDGDLSVDLLTGADGRGANGDAAALIDVDAIAPLLNDDGIVVCGSDEGSVLLAALAADDGPLAVDPLTVDVLGDIPMGETAVVDLDVHAHQV